MGVFLLTGDDFFLLPFHKNFPPIEQEQLLQAVFGNIELKRELSTKGLFLMPGDKWLWVTVVL